ncbi:MAG: DUF2156 domain-containing protein [Clostridia bacterium]|nr:DUF2156 domain-containing protein [Clostridia bacterium]
MISLKKIELEDIKILKAYFNAYPERQCDRSAGATAMWRDYFDNGYAIIDGTLILSSDSRFIFPIGRNVENALDEIEKYCKEKNTSMILCTVNKKELTKLNEKYSDLEANADRDWFDYLYDKESLLTLSGRKYSTPRNHINKFKKLYLNWNFEPINENNISELIEFTNNFTFNSEKDDRANQELQMCIEVLENYKIYDMLGGILRVDEKIVGYSIGEIVGDTLFCHIEKADISYHGAYQMLTNQFLQMYASNDDIKFVNREEDCGDEGLRKSKMSYHPIELIEKNTVKINLK